MKYNFTLFFSVLILFFSTQQIFPQNFLAVNGTKIVDRYGQEVYLKGMGLGGWLEPEGYMFGMSSFANSPSQIQKKILDLIGADNTNTFYNTFRKNFVAEGDIKALASWGFNSVRLPFHYNILTPTDSPGVYLQSGWAIFDSLISWCKKYNIYVILDMHCAPGGESDQTISDYEPSVPSLWQDTAKQTRTVDIWRTIADRYKNEPAVAGYDLLNEPRWNFPGGNQPLYDLYVRITNAIRSVDTAHILFIEGNQYATDFSGLTPPWDKKIVYSFHKYWNVNTSGAIQNYLNIRSSYNAPLWLGETGENSNSWYTDCVNLTKQYDIGWSWWTLKKFNTINGPLNVPITSDYQQLLNYWEGKASKPTVTFAFNALLRMADNLKFENCVFENDVIDAMMRQPNDNSTLPYADNSIPGIIYADNYDMGKISYAYNDVDYENTGVSPQTSWNSGWSYRNDGVDIEQCNDLPTNGFDVGWINSGEWLKHTVNVSNTGSYNFDIRYASNQSGGKMILKLDGNIISSVVDLPVTGGWQNWQTITLQNVQLTTGIHSLISQFLSGGFNINYFLFTLSSTGIENENRNKFAFHLNQNYPNPFNPATEIKYSVPSKCFVTIKVFNILGKEISSLVNGNKNAGEYSVNFDAKNLSSGIYFYRITAGENSDLKKMILLK